MLQPLHYDDGRDFIKTTPDVDSHDFRKTDKWCHVSFAGPHCESHFLRRLWVDTYGDYYVWDEDGANLQLLNGGEAHLESEQDPKFMTDKHHHILVKSPHGIMRPNWKVQLEDWSTVYPNLGSNYIVALYAPLSQPTSNPYSSGRTGETRRFSFWFNSLNEAAEAYFHMADGWDPHEYEEALEMGPMWTDGDTRNCLPHQDAA